MSDSQCLLLLQFENIFQCLVNVEASDLFLIEPYASEYVPKTDSPVCMLTLYNPEYLTQAGQGVCGMDSLNLRT